MELVSRVGKHVYRKNGVVADIKSFGTVQLGYGIKKLDGKYFQVLTQLRDCALKSLLILHHSTARLEFQTMGGNHLLWCFARLPKIGLSKTHPVKDETSAAIDSSLLPASALQRSSKLSHLEISTHQDPLH
ncbi:unnamed protein product [Fraxinus pennsylvanica]|uniref:Uncharacterized protein n=1 Tax=Fraxinus pennsylvanica TaxID=56036 RepID=A0AAD1Z037_9LAMI|nr:unnamed protein product [Fraxinus pennsylvanica]